VVKDLDDIHLFPAVVGPSTHSKLI